MSIHKITPQIKPAFLTRGRVASIVRKAEESAPPQPPTPVQPAKPIEGDNSEFVFPYWT